MDLLSRSPLIIITNQEPPANQPMKKPTHALTHTHTHIHPGTSHILHMHPPPPLPLQRGPHTPHHPPLREKGPSGVSWGPPDASTGKPVLGEEAKWISHLSSDGRCKSMRLCFALYSLGLASFSSPLFLSTGGVCVDGCGRCGWMTTRRMEGGLAGNPPSIYALTRRRRRRRRRHSLLGSQLVASA